MVRKAQERTGGIEDREGEEGEENREDLLLTARCSAFRPFALMLGLVLVMMVVVLAGNVDSENWQLFLVMVLIRTTRSFVILVLLL
jgi:hypothetical protein